MTSMTLLDATTLDKQIWFSILRKRKETKYVNQIMFVYREPLQIWGVFYDKIINNNIYKFYIYWSWNISVSKTTFILFIYPIL